MQCKLYDFGVQSKVVPGNFKTRSVDKIWHSFDNTEYPDYRLLLIIKYCIQD